MVRIELCDTELNLNLENWEDRIDFDLSGVSFSVIGLVRASKNKIFKKAQDIIDGDFDENQIQNFFELIHGEYFILIEKSESIFLYLNYSCPQFYISTGDASSKKLVMNQDESFFNKSSFDQDRFLLRLFCHHSLFVPCGIFSNVTDYLLSGMSMKIDKKSTKYEQSWIIPIEKFCTRNDHEEIARQISDDFVREMDSYKHLNSKFTLQLSSGIDSALMLAAAKKADLHIELVNFRPYLLDGESFGAKQVADYFEYNLREMYRGPTSPDKFFSMNSNIDKYLKKMSPLLETGTGMFILDNISLLLSYNYGYHNTLENSAYAVALCILHHAKYPDFKNPNFIPEKNSKKRYYYSKNYIKSRLSGKPNRDDWNISKYCPDIHEFYYEFLEPCFSGHPDGFNFLKVMPHNDIAKEKLNKSLELRGHNIISKLMLSSYFKKNIEAPSVETAMRLMKILVFINNLSWASSRMFNYRKSNILSQYRPGLNSKILMDLLSVEIDEKLVYYPKWHIFRAFELITGRNFFEVRKMGIKEQILRGFNEIFSLLLYKLNDIEDVRREILINKSLKQFLENNDIICKYENVLSDLEIKDLIPDISLNEPYSKEYSGSEFWYLNNILNIVELKEGNS